MEGAKKEIQRLKKAGLLTGLVTVYIREGVYQLNKTITFDCNDSYPVTYSSYMDENVVFSGGRNITDWTEVELNGNKVWKTNILEVAAGKWYFKSLFVNGQRRTRSRYPKKEYLWIDSVPGQEGDKLSKVGHYACSDTFKYKKGDIGKYTNISDVDVVVHHYWVEERMPIEFIDEERQIIKSSKTSVLTLRDSHIHRFAKYFLDNVFEALTEPGEWYLERKTGDLYYIPMEGESIQNTTVIAPVISQFIKVEGNPESNLFVEHLKFKGLNFEYAENDDVPFDTNIPHQYKDHNEKGIEYATSGCQGAENIPGSISFVGARHCCVESCSVSHFGWYGIEIGNGCFGNYITDNKMFDMGAGGVKLNGSYKPEEYFNKNSGNYICNNDMFDGGNCHKGAIGILSMHSSNNKIRHNHITDMFYSGISCGWILKEIARQHQLQFAECLR